LKVWNQAQHPIAPPSFPADLPKALKTSWTMGVDENQAHDS
jgi:hypothetical protein